MNPEVSRLQRRLLIGFALILTCSVGGGLAYWYYPRTIETASELEPNVGYRIRLTAKFDGDHKQSDLLHFDGTTLMVQHVLGSYEAPDTGQSVVVTGRLHRIPYYAGVSYKYRVDDARWDF